MENSLGEKIKKYRKQSGLSQMDLEVAIESSPGSISRIESGKVNPTKETLHTIIRSLNIPPKEAAELFGVELVDDTVRWLNLAKKISMIHDHSSLLQLAVDEAINIFDVAGASIFRVEGKLLRSFTFTQSWYTKLVLKMIPKKFDTLTLDLKNTDNLLVKSILKNTPYQSQIFTDFSMPTMTYQLSDLLRKLVNFGSGISVPMVHNNKKIGVILFHKSEKTRFSDKEITELTIFTEYIGSVLNNLDDFDLLKKQLEIF